MMKIETRPIARISQYQLRWSVWPKSNGPMRRRLGDRIDPPRAAGERHGVEEEVRHDLAEAEGDDGEVVAAQAQCRRAEQHTEDGGHDEGDDQRRPELLEKWRDPPARTKTDAGDVRKPTV